jgi:hypothetical protein
MMVDSLAKRATRKIVKRVRSVLGKPAAALKPEKVAAIDEYWKRFAPTSFADLGGVWRVEGGYAFHAANKPNTHGYLVDTDITSIVSRRLLSTPSLQHLLGNFGDPAIVKRLGEVDVVFLFDTLLHQVRPNWDEVLAMYAEITKGFILFNQQWISGDETVRLLELGEARYMEAVPSQPKEVYGDLFQKLDTPHPQHGGRLWRDVHNVWQWGISDADLRRVMDKLGFKLQVFRNCGQFGQLKDFENHLFIYTKK